MWICKSNSTRQTQMTCQNLYNYLCHLIVCKRLECLLPYKFKHLLKKKKHDWRLIKIYTKHKITNLLF